MTSWGRGMGDAVRGKGRGDATTATATAEQRMRSPHGRVGSSGVGRQERGAGRGRGGRRGPALHCSRAAAGKRDARPGETQAEKETGLGARAWCCGRGSRGPPPSAPTWSPPAAFTPAPP